MADTETLKPGELRAAMQLAAGKVLGRQPQREYGPEIAHITRLRVIQGYNIDQLSILLDADLGQIAAWALEHPAMYAALTPTDLEASAYWTKRRNNAAQQTRAKRARHAARPDLHLKGNMRIRMWAAMKRERGGGKTSSLSFLGYTMAELVIHLEARFLPGMSWANYGKWHVDHIKPCAAFDLTDKAQFDECWALSNLQPLWARDNIRKGAKH